MSECAVQSFTGITQQRFACLIQNAQAVGIAISGNSGQASKEGITIKWAYDPVAETLSIQCVGHTFFATCGMINSRIHDLVDSCP